jgi:glyoxylase-like metal-dependent hydrolase (beta-lactamase superfamily II)
MQILFSGDTLFKQGMGRTDLPGGDWEALQESLERLFALDGAIRVYPGHGPETTIAAEQ